MPIISDNIFEKLALHEHILNAEQIKACKKLQKNNKQDSHNHSLATIAVSQKLISEKQLQTLIQQVKHKLQFGDYVIRGLLGVGGLSRVYLAWQLSMKREVALKVLFLKWMQDDEFRKRFLIEARVGGRLSHPNLIQVYDIGYARHRYFFSMEYVRGKNAEQMIEAGGIPLKKTLEIALQVLDALEYIWKQNLIHRDIKPSNIMLNEQNIVKLSDLGFIWTPLDSSLASPDSVVGTPDYIAPEQARGLKIDYHCDIYSLGATLYHMLTSTAPFDGSESMVIDQHLTAAIPSPRRIIPDIPEGVCQIIEKMMAKEPKDRYHTAEELRQDLKRVLDGQTPVSLPLDHGKSTISKADHVFAKGSPVLELERLQQQIYFYQVVVASLCLIIVALVVFLFIE